MLRQLSKNRQKNSKGQNTAEYALLIALVIAAIIAMQQYAQRSLQARMRDASTYMTEQTAAQGLKPKAGSAAYQYESYLQESNYQVSRNAEESKRLGEGLVAADAVTNRTRTGETRTSYDTTKTAPETRDMPRGL